MSALEVGGWRITHRGGRVYLTDNHADADPGMPPAVAQRLAVELIRVSDLATWDEGEPPGPVQVNAAPAGPGAATSVPTLDQIKRVRRPEDADRLIRAAGEEFAELVFQAVSAMHRVLRTRDHAREWWVLASVKARREVLEYAVELHEQQQHETSAGGALAPPGPAAGTQSPSGHLSQGKAEEAGGDDPEGGHDE